MSEWITITAKFDSSCSKCGNEILKDDLILWNKKEKKVKHQTCPEKKTISGIFIDDGNNEPITWKDHKKYSYTELQRIKKCQCCGSDLKDESDSYIDDDRKVCVNCFGK